MYDAPSGTLEPCPQSGHLDAETPQHSHWHQADLCHHHQVCLDPLPEADDSSIIDVPFDAFLSSAGSGGILRQSI